MPWGLDRRRLWRKPYEGQGKWVSRDSPPEPAETIDPPRQPAAASETLDDAWRAALQYDERIKSGGWNVSAADQARAAACAEGCPSVSVGANALAVSEQISVASPVGDLPLFGQGSLGFHAVVTQPIYTAGKIDSQVAAAGAEVSASRAEVEKTRLDVKMNVAELYVAVLRGKRVVDVAREQGRQPEGARPGCRQPFSSR